MRLPTAAILALLAGCGPAAPPAPRAATPDAPPGTPAPAVEPDPTPGPPAVAAPPKSPASGEPVRGELGGAAFAPAVTHQGPKLVFTTPERTVTLTLPSADWAGKVAPEDAPGPRVPQVEVSARPPGKPPETALYVNGYTLALELAPEQNGDRAGKVALELPDDAKSRFAGAFTATRPPRGVAERPGEADAPYIQGSVTLAGGPAAVTVTAVAALEAGLAFEQVTGPAQAPEAGQVLAASVESNPPRTAAYVRSRDGGDRYEFTHLPPGRYLVAARVQPDGPAAWAHVDLAPGGRIDAPMALDRAGMGRVAVKLPAGSTGDVKLIPADAQAGARAIPDVALAAAVKYEATVRDGGAAFDAVAPGRYRVLAAGRVGAVAVESGKPAQVDLGK